MDTDCTRASHGTNGSIKNHNDAAGSLDLVRTGSRPGQGSVEDAARSSHVGQAAKTITVRCIVGERVVFCPDINVVIVQRSV